MPRLLLALVLLLSSCSDNPAAMSDDSEPMDDPEPIELSIVVSEEPLTSLGESRDVDATGLNSSGDEVSLSEAEWFSSDESVLRVFKNSSPDARGTIQAVANGSSTLTVESAGLAATVEIEVQQEVANIIAGNTDQVRDLELPGDTLRFDVFVSDARGNPMVTADISWASARPEIVSVGADGTVTAEGFGRAPIMASDGGTVDTAFVEVVGDRFFLSNGTRLRYTLDKPTTAGPWPALVWAHGSGMLTRDTQRGATDPLVPEGMAILRFDKRGVGESAGDYTGVSTFNSDKTLRQLAEDVANGVRFLRRMETIDATRTGVAGNSQGGWIAPLATTFIDDIAFMMLWSGPTVSVGLEIFYSGLADGTSTSLDNVYAQLDSYSGSTGYDPEAILSVMNIPSIWSWGEMDRSIPTRIDTTNANRYAASGLPFEYIVYPNAGHDLRNPATGTFYAVQQDWIAWLRTKGILD